MGCRKLTFWTCCVPIPTPHDDPEGAPTFFIDRDLGRKAFPEGLRQAGLRVVTLAEHYGIPQDQEIVDHEWMLEAAGRGWPITAMSPPLRMLQECCGTYPRSFLHVRDLDRSSIESIPIASSGFHSNDTYQMRRLRV